MEKESLVTNSKFCRNVLLVSVLPFTVGLGYDFTCLNSLIPVLFKVYNSTYLDRYGVPLPDRTWTLLIALTMSLLVAGALVGSLTVQYFLKYFTRRNAMIAAHSSRIIGALITCLGCGISGSYEAFLIGRTILGWSDALGLGISSVYICEVCIKRDQGKYLGLLGIGFAAGNVLGPVISLAKVLGTVERWTGVVAFSTLPSVIFLCCAYWIPKSPFSLLRESNKNAAYEVIERLRTGSKDEILAEISAMLSEQTGFTKVSKTEEVDHSPTFQKIGSLMKIMKKKQHRRQFFTVCFVYMGARLTGINHILFYSNQILIRAGIDQDKVTYVTIGLFAMQLLATFIGHRLMAKYGSKNLLIGSQVIVLVSHIITTSSMATQHLSPVAGYFSVLGLLLTLIGIIAGPNLAQFALTGELTIEPTRPIIVKYSQACMWFCAWFSGFIAPYLDKLLGPYAMLVWAGCVGVYLLFIYFRIPQTRGTSPEEIQEFFKRK